MKVYADSFDHEGTGPYLRNDYRKRTEPEPDEAQEDSDVQKRNRSRIPGFPAFEGQEYL